MKKQEKIMICHHSEIVLCVEILKILIKKAHDLELKTYLHHIINELNDITSETYEFLKEYAQLPNDDLSTKQKVTLAIDRFKTRMINNDFMLCMEFTEILHTILFKSMKFMSKNKKVIQEYLNLVDKQVSLCLSLENEISHFIHETYLNF